MFKRHIDYAVKKKVSNSRITNLTKDQITVRIDMDNFEECPGDWQIVDGTIILNYNIEETKLILKNSGCTIIFDNQ